jgi:4-oxalocrotonate tautomerase family enzyme
MPSIRLTVPAGDLTDEQKSALVEQITNTVGDFYLEMKDEEVYQFVNVRIVETAENGYAVGGEIIG